MKLEKLRRLMETYDEVIKRILSETEYIVTWKKDIDNSTFNQIKFDKRGIWIMFGKKGEKYDCLEVGQTKNSVSKELSQDIKLLNKEYPNANGDETYVKQRFDFSKKFTKRRNEVRRNAKYRDISNNYDEIIVFYDKSSEIMTGKEERRQRERLLAEGLKALYWYS